MAKKKNHVKAGNELENKVLNALKADDWHVAKAGRKIMYIKGRTFMKGNDMLACDLVANRRGNHPVFLQVTYAENFSEKFAELEDSGWTPLDQVYVLSKIKVKNRVMFRLIDITRENVVGGEFHLDDLSDILKTITAY